MTAWRSIVIGICFAAAGCVHGYGGCLWTQPVKHTLSGRVHFRSYPTPDGIDNVPVLTLDHESLHLFPGAKLHVPVGR